MSSARNVKKVENSRRVGKARSGYNKGTIRDDLRYLVVSKDVRRHRLISIDYICHGRGREFESRRSEEHTSELQSRLHLVCRLLLEKKKKELELLDSMTKDLQPVLP